VTIHPMILAIKIKMQKKKNLKAKRIRKIKVFIHFLLFLEGKKKNKKD
jgi:hypothetical protein